MALEDQREQFFQGIDAENLLTTREALVGMKIWDKTIELIGICCGFDDSKSNLFKFILRNNEGDKVQVLAWGNDARRIQGTIKTNFIVHIDAGVARPKNSMHSLGTIPMDVTVSSHTKINVLQKMNDVVEPVNSVAVKIEDVMNIDLGTMLAVEGHTNSEIMPMASGSGQICLVDDVWKLEIRLQHYVDANLKENQHVKVVGKIFNASPIPYVMVDNLRNISLTDRPPLTEENLLKGTQIPKRKADEKLANKEKLIKVD